MIWILGADDAEMRAIQSLLVEAGQQYLLGLVRDRQGNLVRVPPGGAAAEMGEVYLDGVMTSYSIDDYQDVIAIEVAGPWGSAHIDHHGDAPAASFGPDRFFEASSIGQVIARLSQLGQIPVSWVEVEWATGCSPATGFADICYEPGRPGTPSLAVWSGDCYRRIPAAYVFEAAADHCLAAAFAGQCSGIDPTPGSNFYLCVVEARRSTFAPGMSSEEFAEVFAASLDTLRQAPVHADLDDGSGFFRDLTSLPVDGPIVSATGEQYPAEFQFGPLIGSVAGLGYIVRINRYRKVDGQWVDPIPAYRLGGCGLGTAPGTHPIATWLAGYGVGIGCYGADYPAPNNLYGSPVRGFAGGTVGAVDVHFVAQGRVLTGRPGAGAQTGGPARRTGRRHQEGGDVGQRRHPTSSSTQRTRGGFSRALAGNPGANT